VLELRDRIDRWAREAIRETDMGCVFQVREGIGRGHSNDTESAVFDNFALLERAGTTDKHRIIRSR
jgi:hypothetical protein